jgi:hypothetical protein
LGFHQQQPTGNLGWAATAVRLDLLIGGGVLVAP